MSEARYTLAEARRVEALRSCAAHGHDWTIHQSLQGGVHVITCGTCGWSGRVTMGDKPVPPSGEATS